MPLFILYGGEIVLLVIVTRIALWILRSGGLRLPPEPGPTPPGPKGTPYPLPAASASAAPSTPVDGKAPIRWAA